MQQCTTQQNTNIFCSGAKVLWWATATTGSFLTTAVAAPCFALISITSSPLSGPAGVAIGLTAGSIVSFAGWHATKFCAHKTNFAFQRFTKQLDSHQSPVLQTVLSERVWKKAAFFSAALTTVALSASFVGMAIFTSVGMLLLSAAFLGGPHLAPIVATVVIFGPAIAATSATFLLLEKTKDCFQKFATA